MDVTVLGCSGGQSPGFRLTCLLIGERVALDAGSLSEALPLERQRVVHSIVLSHSHMDHLSSLPFFIENAFSQGAGSIEIYASQATVYAIRKYLFNNSTWPDFTRIPNHLLPAMRFHEIEEEVPFELDGVRFTPFAVDHVVPTFGFLVEQGSSALLWSSDTGPTRRLWELANSVRNLKAVCVDTSFDNALQNVADVSLHLTPQGLAGELRKLARPVPVLVHHVKPGSAKRIREEVKALRNPDLEFLEQGKTYRF
jgi:ribonuclease BN (tRNA processing enzyme)